MASWKDLIDIPGETLDRSSLSSIVAEKEDVTAVPVVTIEEKTKEPNAFSELLQAFRHDAKLHKELMAIEKFAASDVAIEELIERIDMVTTFTNEFSTLTATTENLVYLAQCKLLDANEESISLLEEEALENESAKAYHENMTRAEYQEHMNMVRLQVKAEVKILRKALRAHKRQDNALKRTLRKYLTVQKARLTKAQEERDTLYQQYESRLSTCDTLEDIYMLSAEIETSYQSGQQLENLKVAIDEKMASLKSSIQSVKEQVERKRATTIVENTVKRQGTVFPSEEMLKEAENELYSLFDLVKKSKYSPIVTRKAHNTTIKHGGYTIVFNEESYKEYAVFLSGMPLLSHSTPLCMTKELKSLLNYLEKIRTLL